MGWGYLLDVEKRRRMLVSEFVGGSLWSG
jgi:hypothetical protein